VIGEIVGQLACGESPQLDVSLLSPRRFSG